MSCSCAPFRIHLPMDQRSKGTINFIIYSFNICTTYEVDNWNYWTIKCFVKCFNKCLIKWTRGLKIIFDLLGYIFFVFFIIGYTCTYVIVLNRLIF